MLGNAASTVRQRDSKAKYGELYNSGGNKSKTCEEYKMDDLRLSVRFRKSNPPLNAGITIHSAGVGILWTWRLYSFGESNGSHHPLALDGKKKRRHTIPITLLGS